MKKISRSQKLSSGKNLKMNAWEVIRQNRLRRLHGKTDLEVNKLMLAIPKVKLDMWYHLNGVAESRCNARQIFYKAITQSSARLKSKRKHGNITFHRNLRAEFTNQIYKQLFRKADPKLEMSEEICKYLDI